MERCITAGNRDRTVRLWKIVEESQLIFRGGGSESASDVTTDIVSGLLLPSEVEDAKRQSKKAGGSSYGGSIDVVAFIDEDTFVSGTDSGFVTHFINFKSFVLTNFHNSSVPSHYGI
jgi:ribosomal RNA-processing protein 9